MTIAPLPIPDRVVIATEDEARELTMTEFLRLPLSHRIRCVIERTATFYAAGQEVDRHEALDAMRLLRVASWRA